MKQPVAILLLVAGVLAGAAAAGSAPVRAQPSISIVGYGQYRTKKTGEAFPTPRTAAGRTVVVFRPRLVKRTNVIFGQLGRHFGVEIDLHGFGEEPARLTIRTVHPPLTNPETGETTRVSEYDRYIEERRNVFFGYVFSYRWELAEGNWVRQFFYRGRLLAQQRFRVVVPLN